MSISFMSSTSMFQMNMQTSSSQTSIVNNGFIGNLNVNSGGGGFMSTFGALDQATNGGSYAFASAGPNGAFAAAGTNGGGNAMAAAGPGGAFASAGGQNQQAGNPQMNPMKMMMGLFMAMAQMMGLGQQQPQQPQQPQQNDPLAGNKQMGQKMQQMAHRMHQMGGDLKDDGILNHSNQKPNPQKMMMAFLGMAMQSMMQLMTGGMQQQNQFNSPFQMLS